MGLSPEMFGPCMWATIHYICLGSASPGATIEPAKQQALRQFISLLPSVIPCHKCSEHLTQNLQTLPVDSALGSPEDMFKWSVTLHNMVNKQLGKKEVSVDEAQTIWKSNPNLFIAPAETSHKRSYESIVFFIIGILIGISLYFGYTRVFAFRLY